ncbi:MAG: glycosyltransferase family 2 protein [Sakamotonia sp.]|jgi:glycosyltransferase involved in cell wall biosynthesis
MAVVSVSLCMIVKNEEEVLGRCLDSVAGFPDEILVTDTGSTDGTKDVARERGARIFDFPWRDDFSAARNFSFSQGKGTYLFWLDADDVVRPDQRQRLMELKRRLGQGNGLPDMVMMKYAAAFHRDGSLAAAFYRERLIRRGPEAVWRGRVHETVQPFGIIWKEDIWIEHRKLRIRDPERNLRILESMRRQGEAFGPREQYYYGRELEFNRRYREAALVSGRLPAVSGNERFVNGRYL